MKRKVFKSGSLKSKGLVAIVISLLFALVLSACSVVAVDNNKPIEGSVDVISETKGATLSYSTSELVLTNTYNYSANTLSVALRAGYVYKFEIWGAQGGNSTNSFVGGNGGYSVGFYSMVDKAATTANVYIGSRGNTGTVGTGGAAGGGGGSSEIRVGGTAVSNRVIVAGGGGGAGTGGAGGAGGGSTGTAGVNTNNSYSVGGAGGGTSAGGAGGTGGVAGSAGATAANGGAGGTGATGSSATSTGGTGGAGGAAGGKAGNNGDGGGGGGGGYAGGGGGGGYPGTGTGSGAGGGGGSGYIDGVDSLSNFAASMTNGNRTGAGYATITEYAVWTAKSPSYLNKARLTSFNIPKLDVANEATSATTALTFNNTANLYLDNTGTQAATDYFTVTGTADNLTVTPKVSIENRTFYAYMKSASGALVYAPISVSTANDPVIMKSEHKNTVKST